MQSKKFLSALLALLMMVGVVAVAPITASAATAVTPMVSAGQSHSLALENDGTVWAWGRNTVGELGDGTTTNRGSPVQVMASPGVPLGGVTAVAAGAYDSHSLALKSDGTVLAWGNNVFGQLGDGTTTARHSPVQVTGLSGVTTISASYHSLALKSDGTVWAWGYNIYGQLGDGTSGAGTNKSSPAQVPGLADVTAIAAGGGGSSLHSLALKNDGTVWAWGRNNYGQLGDGTTTDRSSPVQVPGLTGVAAIEAGSDYSMALKSDGTLVTWGRNNRGQLGDGTTTQRVSPVQVMASAGVPLEDVAAIAAGGTHAVVLKSDGTVWSWGSNSAGKLGDGTTADSSYPVQVSGLSDVVAIAAGEHTLALKNDGTVFSWGYNGYGELGDGTTTNRNSPVQVGGGLNLGTAPVDKDALWAAILIFEMDLDENDWTAASWATALAKAQAALDVYLDGDATQGEVDAAKGDLLSAIEALVPYVPAPVPPSITTATLPGGTYNAAYTTTTLAATGDTPITWSATGLPGGLACSTAGVISGTPTATGTFSVVVTASNGVAPNGSETFSLIIAKAGQAALTINDPGAKLTTDADFTLTTAGGTGGGGVTYAQTGGTAGTVSSAGLVHITGVGTITMTATKEGGANYNDVTSAELTITVTAAPVDKTALDARLEAIGGTRRGHYTHASWRAFRSALRAARAAAKDENATQAEVDEALRALNAAFGNLQPKMIFTTHYRANRWNWFRFIVLFGWIWMWFI